MFPGDWLRLSRFREWSQSKLPYVAGSALLLAGPERRAATLCVMVATVAPWAAFGYAINDVADRDTDRRGGKANRAAELPAASRGLFLLLAGSGALGLSLTWAPDAAAPLLVLAGLLLAAAYSLSPLRLKERGALGLVAAAAAQWSLPVLALSAAEPRGWLRPAAWLLALLGFAIGLRWIAVHQQQDLAADRKAGVRTHAVESGSAAGVILAAFGAELLLLTAALTLTWPRSWPAVAALGAWMVVAEIPRLRRQPLRARLGGYAAAPLGAYYFAWLPGSLALGRILSGR